MSLWRHDPLTDRTVRIAARRAARPSDFDAADEAARRCPFCAGAEADTPPERLRIDDGRGGWLSRVVPNLYPIVADADGLHEVVVESPRHARRLLDLTDDEAAAAAWAWVRRLDTLRREGYGYTLLFKNEGRLAGATLEHVHSQVVAMPSPPGAVEAMWRRVAERGLAGETTLYADHGLRVLAPPAPRVGYEAWVASDTGGPSLAELAADQAAAARLGRLTQRMVAAAMDLGDASALNLVLNAPPTLSEAAPWWLEVLPRRGLAAGLEIATGVWVSSVEPETASQRLRERLGE